VSYLSNTNSSCFALLDDANSSDQNPSSRLYTRLLNMLTCDDASSWQTMWQQLQLALGKGYYGLALLSYETGAALQDVADWDGVQSISQVLIFESCEQISRAQSDQFLAQNYRKVKRQRLRVWRIYAPVLMKKNSLKQ